jgi:DNA-binding response OmpR family regulator
MNKPLEVLMIEDDPHYVALVQQWLSEGTERTFALRWTDSLEAGLSRLKQGGVDLILLDLGLPDSGGLETFTKVKERAAGIPLIVLRGDNTEQLALHLVQAHAHDSILYKSSSNRVLLTKMIHYAMAAA